MSTNQTTPAAVQRSEGPESLVGAGLSPQSTAAASASSSGIEDRIRQQRDADRAYQLRRLKHEAGCYHPGKTRTDLEYIPALGSDEARLWITTDEYTAWLDGGGNIRFLLEKAGIYRRRWDRAERCWIIPVGEVDKLIPHAQDEWRMVTVDGVYAKRANSWGL